MLGIFPRHSLSSAVVSVSLGCCLLLCWHVDKVSGYVLQPSESKPNVTPVTVLAHVLCAIKSYAHLLYVQRLIPHQVCCTIRLAFPCFCYFCSISPISPTSLPFPLASCSIPPSTAVCTLQEGTFQTLLLQESPWNPLRPGWSHSPRGRGVGAVLGVTAGLSSAQLSSCAAFALLCNR